MRKLSKDGAWRIDTQTGLSCTPLSLGFTPELFFSGLSVIPFSLCPFWPLVADFDLMMGLLCRSHGLSVMKPGMQTHHQTVSVLQKGMDIGFTLSTQHLSWWTQGYPSEKVFHTAAFCVVVSIPAAPSLTGTCLYLKQHKLFFLATKRTKTTRTAEMTIRTITAITPAPRPPESQKN